MTGHVGHFMRYCFYIALLCRSICSRQIYRIRQFVPGSLDWPNRRLVWTNKCAVWPLGLVLANGRLSILRYDISHLNHHFEAGAGQPTAIGKGYKDMRTCSWVYTSSASSQAIQTFIPTHVPLGIYGLALPLFYMLACNWLAPQHHHSQKCKQ